MNPTPEQLTRSTELAPRIVGIVEVPFSRSNQYVCLPGCVEYLSILDPRAFQAVMLALPRTLSSKAKLAADAVFIDTHWGKGDDWLPFHAWLLTPAGMLAFYEALVAAHDV